MNTSQISYIVHGMQGINPFPSRPVVFSLTKGQRLKCSTVLSVMAVHQAFYISICMSTLPTQYTRFISPLLFYSS